MNGIHQRQVMCGKCGGLGHNRRTCVAEEKKMPTEKTGIKRDRETVEVAVVTPTAKERNVKGPIVKEPIVIDLVSESDDSPKGVVNNDVLHWSQDECSICLSLLSADTVNETCCGHKFHQMCLWSWLILKTECPICPMCNKTISLDELVELDREIIKV